MRRELLDHVLVWNACDLERKLREFQTYYNSARAHASLDGHTPLTFAGGHLLAPADLSQVRWVSTPGTSSSSRSPPDSESETHRR